MRSKGRRFHCTWAAPARALALVGALVAVQALAQTPPPPPPPPDVPPAAADADADLAPQITITRKSGETVEEARVNGKLMWIRVTPSHGHPYYLIPDAGGHTYIRRDSNDTGLKIPLWVLFSF